MTAPFQPGQRQTEERLNAGQMIGRLVAHATRTAAQTISSGFGVGDGTDIIWDNIVLDDLSGFSGAEFTPNVAGWYIVSFSISFEGSTGNRRGGFVRLNGGVVDGSRVIMPVVSNTVMPSREMPVACNGTTDAISVRAQQDSGGDIDTNTDSLVPEIHIVYSRPL